MLQDVLSSITVVHAVSSMCEVALLVQHVTHPDTQYGWSANVPGLV